MENDPKKNRSKIKPFSRRGVKPESQPPGGNGEEEKKPPAPPEQKHDENYHISSWTDEEIKEKINTLNSKETNLIFTFGYTGASKTTLLAGISHYLKLNYQVVEHLENSEANRLLEQIRTQLNEKRFPSTTDVQKMYEYDIGCRREPHEPLLYLTFCEMSGEKHKAVAYKHGGKLPREVEIYLRENKLPLLVMIVIGYDELKKTGRFKDSNIINQDSLVASFINYLAFHQIQCHNIGIIISKYDRDKIGDARLEDEVQECLGQALNQIKFINPSFKVFPFSVGQVSEGTGTGGVDEIIKLDLSDCEPIVEWIFDSLAGKPKPQKKNRRWF